MVTSIPPAKKFAISNMGQKISIVILLIAILFKVVIVCIYFRAEEDMLNQALAARNLIGGHGMTIEQVHASNLSKIVFEPVPGWPPGYSWLVDLIYPFCGKNLLVCCLVISLSMHIAFLILIWRLVLFLRLPFYVGNLMILFNSLIVPDYIRQSTPTDLPGLFFCLLSCYLLMNFMTREKQTSKFGIELGIFNGLASYMRYMYMGVCFIIPLFLIWNGYKKKDKRLFSGGIYSLITTGFMVACLFAFQQYYTGKTIYLRPASKGFFLSNLETLHPFVISSVFNLRLYAVQVSRLTHMSFATVMEIANFTGFILMLALMYAFIQYSKRKKLIAGNRYDIFFMTGGFICIFSLLLLTYLSLTIDKNYGPLANEFWTYVSENRYFAFACTFLALCFCCWLFIYEKNNTSKFMSLLRTFFLVAITIEILHGVYLISKYELGNQTNSWSGPIPNQVKQIISQIQKENTSDKRDLVFTSVNNFFCNVITLEGGRCLYYPVELNKQVIKAERPTTLVAILQNKDLYYFGSFLSNPGVKRIAVSGNYTFFVYYADPPGTK